jgi:hypothetical protein
VGLAVRLDQLSDGSPTVEVDIRRNWKCFQTAMQHVRDFANQVGASSLKFTIDSGKKLSERNLEFSLLCGVYWN